MDSTELCKQWYEQWQLKQEQKTVTRDLYNTDAGYNSALIDTEKRLIKRIIKRLKEIKNTITVSGSIGICNEFIDWLKERKKNLPNITEKKLKSDFSPNNIKYFKLNDYALMQVYLMLVDGGEPITNLNKDNFAKKYGFKTGHKLYQMYNKYRDTKFRTTIDTPRKDKEHKKRLERVIELLKKTGNQKALSRAEDEYKTFIVSYNKHY